MTRELTIWERAGLLLLNLKIEEEGHELGNAGSL